MCAAWKSPFFYIFFVVLVTIVIVSAQPAVALPPDSVSVVADTTVMDALKKGDLTSAEKFARAELQEPVEKTAGSDSEEKNPSASDTALKKREALTALATVLAARAWEADQRSRSSKITGSDIIFLIVVLLLAGSLLAAVLRYGPQRPKLIDQTVQWMGKVKRENQDDGFRQAGAALFSLLILGLVGVVLFFGLWLTMHIVADMDKRVLDNPQAQKFYDEAKSLMAAARDSEKPEVKYENYDVLSLYSSFLHKVGNDKLSNAVALRALALRNQCGRCNLKQRTKTAND